MPTLRDDVETVETRERRANSGPKPLLHSTLMFCIPSRQSSFISQLTSKAG